MAHPTAFYDPSDDLVRQGFIIDIFHVPTGRSVKFKGWVKNFADSYQSNWNTEDAYGRMDPISTFQNTQRKLTIEWDVVAASTAEARKNMGNCELLFRMLYPTYDPGNDNASNIQQSPLFKLKYGNLISAPGVGAAGDAKSGGLLGTMGGFEYSPDFDAGFFTPTDGEMYPQLIELSAEFQVLHNFPVGWEQGKGFRAGEKYPYGLAIEEAAESPSVSERDRARAGSIGHFQSTANAQNAPSRSMEDELRRGPWEDAVRRLERELGLE